MMTVGSSPFEVTARVVAAYASNSRLMPQDLPGLIQSVHSVLLSLSNGGGHESGSGEAQKPAVPIKKSVTGDYIICLEDGLKFKSLKRHLRSSYKMTPEEYRAKWSLPHDYPLVAPSYAAPRSRHAK